jgi:hypothetical protein
MQSSLTPLNQCLDQVETALLAGNRTEPPLFFLGEMLNRLYPLMQAGPDCPIKQACLGHNVRKLLHEDPYTLRAFEKPRGYAGDAVLLDYIYSSQVPENTSEIGQSVFCVTTRAASAKSVVARRDLLTRLIDETVESHARPSILSVACGHLREAQQSHAVRDGKLNKFYALDQDGQSLAVIDREQRTDVVVPVLASIKDLLKGTVDIPQVQLAYAAGLLDYLNKSAAEALVARMWKLLAPGGSLLVANFTSENSNRGYMATFMAWELLYRSRQDIEQLADVLPQPEVAQRTSFIDDLGNIVYLKLQKA